MQRFSNVGNNLTKITVPGNGDCFYHSVMTGIISDVLTGRLPDHSPAAARIQTVLLPEITRQLVRRGKPAFDFSCVGLKQAVMELLRTVPISELDIPQRSDVILPLDDTDSQEVKVIKNCDLYHLLIDICSPAMRIVMLSSSEEYKDNLEPVIKELFKVEFSSFMMVEHADELGVDFSRKAAAKNQLSGGELYGVDDHFRLPLCVSWCKSSTAVLSSFVDNHDVDTSINIVFESWWRLNSSLVWAMYKAMHTTPRTMAGKPQQMALSYKLFCDFKVRNSSNDNLYSLTPVSNQQHSLVFCNRLSHVDAMVYGDADNKIVTALQERMDSFQLCREVMNEHSYPWALYETVSDSKQQIEPAAFVSVPNSFGLGILSSTLLPMGFGLWRPANYVRSLADDQAASRTADVSSSAGPSLSYQPDVD